VLDTDLKNGLAQEEAKARIGKYGPNELERSRRPALWRLFLANWANPILLLLTLSGLVSLALQEWPEGIAILVIVLIDVTLYTYTEKSSGDALQALVQMTAPSCRVRRRIGNEQAAAVAAAQQAAAAEAKTEAISKAAAAGPSASPSSKEHAVGKGKGKSTSAEAGTLSGVTVEMGDLRDVELGPPADTSAGEAEPDSAIITIPARELVPGDLVVIESGSVVPADCRVIESIECRVDESMLTGESIEVRKERGEEEGGGEGKGKRGEKAGGEKQLSPSNMLFSGTHMTAGRALAVVVTTGMKTRIGRIAAMLKSKKGREEEERALEEEEEAAAVAAAEELAEEEAARRSPSPNIGGLHHRKTGTLTPMLYTAPSPMPISSPSPSVKGASTLPPPTARYISPLDAAEVAPSASYQRAMERRRIAARLARMQGNLAAGLPEPHPYSVIDAAHFGYQQESEGEDGSGSSGTPPVSTTPEVVPPQHERIAQKTKAKVRERRRKAKEKASMLGFGADKETTALQSMIDKLGLGMSGIAVIACIIVFIVGVLRDYTDPSRPNQPTWLLMLLTAVSLAVSAIPESLPLAVTICLALGSWRLAEAKTLVRQLPAVENLGMATVVCSDKTGTLTQGKMTTTHLYTQGKTCDITGKGYSTQGKVIHEGSELSGWRANEQLGVYATMLLGGILCNNTEISFDPETQKPVVQGSMSEAPLVVAAAKLGLTNSHSPDNYPRLDEIPFHSARKIMATLHKNTTVLNAGNRLTAKSAAVRDSTPVPSHPHTQAERITHEAQPRSSPSPSSFVFGADEPKDPDAAGHDPSDAPLLQEEKKDVNQRPRGDSTKRLRFKGDSDMKKTPGTGSHSGDGVGDGSVVPLSPRSLTPKVSPLLSSPYFSAVKGAPGYIIDRCDRVLDAEGQVSPLNSAGRKHLTEVVDSLSSQSLRVLAIAYKPFDKLPYRKAAAEKSDNDKAEMDSKSHDNGPDNGSSSASGELGDSAEDTKKKADILATKLVFIGFMASIDPARDGVRESIETAEKAGIRTIMITGDYLLTAVAIAKSIGLIPLGADPTGNLARDASELRQPNGSYLSDVQVDELTSSTQVFARATPEDKLVIVRSLQRLGHTVAMTGDGVNDAASLQAADIGIAMGSGTAVAHQASNMVITDDSFSTIIVAIHHGRAIYANIQKFVLFLLGTNTVQVLLILVSVAVGLPLPLTPLAILFINLATDGLCAVALSVERGEAELMDMPPRKKGQFMLHGIRWVMLFGHAVALAAAMLLVYLLLLYFFTGHLLASTLRLGHTPEGSNGEGINQCREYHNLDEWVPLTDDECIHGIAKARSALFITFCFAEILRGYTVRNFMRPIWHRFWENKTMVIGSMVSFGLMIFFVCVPGARDLFGLTPFMPYWTWLFAFAAAMAVAALDEGIKRTFQRRMKKRQMRRMVESNFDRLLGEMRAVMYKVQGIEDAIKQLQSDTKKKDHQSIKTLGLNGET